MTKEIIEARIRLLEEEHQKAVTLMTQARDRAIQIEGALLELRKLLAGEKE